MMAAFFSAAQVKDKNKSVFQPLLFRIIQRPPAEVFLLPPRWFK